jgi:hypothetical protein
MVRTSARPHGRASDGLAELLRRLHPTAGCPPRTDRSRKNRPTKGGRAHARDQERARPGESRQSSKSSTKDISSSRRGGLRSHEGSGGRTKEQLYNEAKKKNVKGRSKMNKQELAHAVGRS